MYVNICKHYFIFIYLTIFFFMPIFLQADQNYHYPKLRVRTSWDFENQISEAPVLANPPCHDVSVGSFDASQYSDGHSSSSDENLFQLPDFQENVLQTHSSPRFSASLPNLVGTGEYPEEIGEQTDETSEDLCKEVRCIEMDMPRINRCVEPNMSDSSPNKYVSSNMSDSGPNRYVNSNMFDSSLNRYMNSDISSPIANTAISGVTVDAKGDKENQEFRSPLLKEEQESNSFLPHFVFPSPKKPSPWPMENSAPSSRSLGLTRSKSCKASLMTSLSLPWFEKVEMHESTPATGFEKEFTGRPEELQMKLSALKYDAIIDRLSRSNSQTSAGSAAVDESKMLDAKISIDENSTHRPTSTAVINEIADPQCENQHADHVVSAGTIAIIDDHIHGKNCKI